jgi:hypothetical protein
MNDNFNMTDGMGGMMSWSTGFIGLPTTILIDVKA